MLAWRYTARKLHAHPQPDSGRCIKGIEVATERQLWRENFPPEFPDTQATAVSNMVSVVLPATTLVNDNSDDKPRHLPLGLGSCLSYEPRGIASVTGYC